MAVMPKNPISSHYYRLLHNTIHITIIYLLVLARVNEAPSSGGYILFAHHIHSLEVACIDLGWRYLDGGTILLDYHNRCSNCAH